MRSDENDGKTDDFNLFIVEATTKLLTQNRNWHSYRFSMEQPRAHSLSFLVSSAVRIFVHPALSLNPKSIESAGRTTISSGNRLEAYSRLEFQHQLITITASKSVLAFIDSETIDSRAEDHRKGKQDGKYRFINTSNCAALSKPAIAEAMGKEKRRREDGWRDKNKIEQTDRDREREREKENKKKKAK